MINKKQIQNIKNSLCSDEREDFIFIIGECNKYKKGFNLLMDYFDDINDEDKPYVNKCLKRLGL